MSTVRTTSLEVATPLGPAVARIVRPPRPQGVLVLTHGANGAMQTPDLAALGDAVPGHGWAVALVQQAWAVAGRRVPPPTPGQDSAWLAVVTALRSGRGALPAPLVVGGRSNGARVAARTAHAAAASGVVCLAFPLHPPGRPERLRSGELREPFAHGIPVLVVQGGADAFGTPDEVRAHVPDPDVVVAVQGGHGFTRSPRDVVTTVLAFLDAVGDG